MICHCRLCKGWQQKIVCVCLCVGGLLWRRARSVVWEEEQECQDSQMWREDTLPEGVRDGGHHGHLSFCHLEYLWLIQPKEWEWAETMWKMHRSAQYQ